MAIKGWDIDPAGLSGVLRRTEHVASGFETHVQDMNGLLEGAAQQSSSGLVNSALQGFVEAQAPTIRFCFTRTGACMTGAVKAYRAYKTGDEEMALNAQRSVSMAPGGLFRRGATGGAGVPPLLRPNTEPQP